MEWGREIEVNGVRPVWLRDEWQNEVQAQNRFGDWLDVSINAKPSQWSWPNIPAIRLPADHFAYRALDAGFEPWGGGDAAPDDWDGGQVLYRDGQSAGRTPVYWRAGVGYGSEIIGYRKRVERAELTDTVTIKRMTVAEANARWGAPFERRLSRTEVLHDLGIIKPEATADRISRETGVSVSDVEKVLAAQ